MKSLGALMEGTCNFQKEVFDNNSQWAIIGELYEKNFVQRENYDCTTMPKKIHQIWLGSKIPNKYKKWRDTWKRFNPEWEYRLWTDDDVNDVNIPRRDLFNSIKNYGQKSDFLRYHILNQYGGLYVDTDFECLKPFDTLSYANFIIGVSPMSRRFPKEPELCIGLIGATANHPVMSRVVSNMTKVIGRTSLFGWQKMHRTTGGQYFSAIFFKVVNKYTKGVVVLPPDYFYPFPSNKRFEKNSRDYIKDCSYAIHYWAVSWA